MTTVSNRVVIWMVPRCNSDSNPNLLGAFRNDGGRRLNAYYDNPDNRWNRGNGFAFAVSQLSSFLPTFFQRSRGVLFYQLSTPSAEHLSNLVDFQ